MDFYCRTSTFHLFWVGAEKLEPQQRCPSKWSGTKAEVGPYGRWDTLETIANVHFKRCQNGPEKPICHNNSWPCTEHYPIDSRFPWQRFCVNKRENHRTIKWCESKAEKLLVPYSQMIYMHWRSHTIWFPRKKSLRMLIPLEKRAGGRWWGGSGNQSIVFDSKSSTGFIWKKFHFDPTQTANWLSPSALQWNYRFTSTSILCG